MAYNRRQDNPSTPPHQYQTLHRSEMSVPVRVEIGGPRATNTTVPIAHEKGYNTLGGSSMATSSWFDRSHDDLFGRLDDPMLSLRRSDNDRWFDDMRRRFDERRRQWDAEMQHMRSSFFTNPVLLPSTTNTQGTTSSLLEPASECPVATNYERRDDGSQHFLARFDVHAFDQDDLNVSVRDGQIVMTAAREQRSGNNSTKKQLIRTVDLPKGVDEGLISASISMDKVLLVDAPIRQAIKSPTFTSLGSSGMSDVGTPSSISGTARGSSHVSLRSSPPLLPASYSLVAAKKKFHVEIPVGADYLPNEIQIRTLNNRVYISAHHEERLSTRNTFRDFSKEYDIPEHIDPKSINARLEHGVLHLEGSALF